MRNPFVIQDEGVNIGRAYIHAEWDQATMLGTGDRTVSTLRKTQVRKRLGLFFILLSVLFLCLLARNIFLQMIMGDVYRARAEGNRFHTEYLLAPRGEIVDQYGNQLVQNESKFQLIVVLGDMPRTLEEQDVAIQTLSDAISIPASPLLDRWHHLQNRKVAEFILVDNLVRDAALRFYELRGTFVAFRLIIVPSRVFQNRSLAHVIGLTSQPTDEDMKQHPELMPTDSIGVSGIERIYDDVLRGLRGVRNFEVDSRGRILSSETEEAPCAGTTLKLTIDGALQNFIYQILVTNPMVAHGAHASVVAIDPRSGAVRAIVSIPDYDPNTLMSEQRSALYQQLQNDPRRPLFFRAIAGTYPSGSIIKPILAAAALQEHVITPSTTVHSTGGIRMGNWFFADWKPGGHGVVNVTKAIADSVNTFFYIIGGEDTAQGIKGLGIDRMHTYAESFGLNQRLGIDIPGEDTGFFPSKEWKQNTQEEPWYIGDSYHTAIGQGYVLVTPLQMGIAYSAIANGGTVWQPHVADVTPVMLKKVLPSDEHLSIIRNALRQTVLVGSARRLTSLPFAVAGKTGTAETQPGRLPHAWFVGYGPYENPQLTLVVLVEESGEGSVVAVPIAQQIFEWYYEHRIKPQI